MQSKIQSRIVSDFCLDGAKIIFGSLVVGAFLPNIMTPEFPWLAFAVGIGMTLVFLVLANATAAPQNHNQLNQ